MANTYLVSDTHFGHAGMCRFAKPDGSKIRPWEDPAAMDEADVVPGSGPRVHVVHGLMVKRMCGIVPHMAKSISISDRLYALCRDEAENQHRSIAWQLEHWVMQARHGADGVSHSVWDDLQATLRDGQEVDRQMMASGQTSNKSVAAFGSFDMRREITVNYRKMLGI